MAEYTFPNISLPEKEKSKKSYYETWAKAIVCNSITSNWIANYNKMAMLYSFYGEGTGNNLTGYLQTAPDGSAMPGIWTTQNTIKTRIRSLLGELEKSGYVIKARALNSEAESRKLEEKERLRVKRKLADVLQFIEEETGMQMEDPEYVPQTEDELKEYMDLTWKDKNVLILEAALKWIAKRTHWDETRKRLFLDVLIVNMMVIRNEIVRGVPQSTHVDPSKFIFDPNSTDDMLSDSTYFGEVEYMPLASAAERYGLTTEEIQEAYKSYQTYLGMGMEQRNEADGYFGCMPGQSLKWFKVEDGTPRCLVIRACWRDYKLLAHKKSKNEKYDSDHLADVTNDYVSKGDKEKVIYNKIECWKQATIVGGKFCRDYGDCPNQARDLSSLEVSEPPYKVWIPEFIMGKYTSLVEQLVGLQLLKDIALYQLQIQMARAVGKVLVIDMAMFPDNQLKEEVIGRMKADGVIFGNSKEYQLMSGNMNLFQEFDLSLSESIGQAITLIEYFDKQIDNISGINAERQGQSQGASQGLGVTNSLVYQSNLITASYFVGFERFCSRVLNYQAKLVKVAWAGKERFAPIIGDVGVDFLKDNIDISLDEFDVLVESLPPSAVDRQTLIKWLDLAVQADPGFLPDAMAILLEQDNTIAVRKYQRRYQLRQMHLNKQEQQASEQEQMNQQQQIQLGQDQLQFQRENSPVQLQGMKNQGNQTKALISSRTKLKGDMFKLLK